MTDAQTIPYEIITTQGRQPSNAVVAATRDVNGRTITVVIDDTGSQNTLIQFRLTGNNLTAGETRTYDPTVSVSPDFLWPLFISGNGPGGPDGGTYSGNFLVTEISDAFIGGQVAFNYFVGNALPVKINAEFSRVPLQPCR